MGKFKIILRGDELDPIEISYAEGIALAEDIRQGKVKGLIKVGEHYITASSIKAILPIREIRSEKQSANESQEEVDRQWREWKAMRLSLSPKERAQETSFMDFICSGIRGRRLTFAEKEDVRAAQEKYFTEFPDAHNANPTCYFTQEDISHVKASLPNNDNIPPSLKELLPAHVLNFAEKHLTA